MSCPLQELCALLKRCVILPTSLVLLPLWMKCMLWVFTGPEEEGLETETKSWTKWISSLVPSVSKSLPREEKPFITVLSLTYDWCHFQARHSAVWVATSPAPTPWWTRCAPTPQASSSPHPCPPCCWLGQRNPLRYWRAKRAGCSEGDIRGVSSCFDSCWWTPGFLWSTARATSSQSEYKN